MMNRYAILTNRKRSIIALVHSIVFAGIALRSVAVATHVHPIWANPSSIASLLILLIYVVVSSILIQLTRISGSSRERLYFAFCATSATLGLFRTIIGDQNLPAGQYLRVLMLLCAVVTGLIIVRSHSNLALAPETNA